MGIDDGPFVKGRDREVPVVAVMMEGSTLVEGVALSTFPVDGDRATERLEKWIKDMRWYESLQGIILGGITIAGLGVIEIGRLTKEVGKPVISVTREETFDEELINALRSAGLEDRIQTVEKSPPSKKVTDGLYISFAGAEFRQARHLVKSSLLKSTLPEPLRVAHLIGAALSEGESKGRV